MVTLLVFALPVAAQTVPDTLAAEPVEADLLEGLAETGDPEELADFLDDLRARGLDLNMASASDLAQIPGVTALLARRIVTYRDSIGAFTSLPEVRQVPGVTAEVYESVRPFLRLGDLLETRVRRASRFPALPSRRDWREIDGQFIQRYARRLETARGYRDGRYAGSADRVYTRLRLEAARRLTANVTLEKDPGEAFGWTPETNTYGYDYVSASIGIEDIGRVKAAVAGDYTLSFGQGLVLWRSAALGKSREATRGLNRFGTGLKLYGSTDENTFFRGAATTLLLTPDIAITAFYSRRTLDAMILDPDSGGVGSLGTSGLHRLPNEQSRKDALGQQATGGAAEWIRGRGRLGAAFVATRFDEPLVPRPAPDALFDLRGRTTRAASVFGHFFVGDAVFFGEAATAGEAFAYVGGVEYAAERLGEVVVLARHYPRDFVSLHGYAFGERAGATQNETGVYVGLRLRPRRTLLVQAYVDQYVFPWLRFNVPRPTRGMDALVTVAHTPSPWLRQEVTFRTETKEDAATAPTPMSGTVAVVRPQTRQSLRWQGAYVFSRALTLRTRLEGVRFHAEGEDAATGFLLYQDVHLSPIETLTLEARLALFDTDGYDARVYAYEYDVRYGFSVPAFFGRGARQYALIRWEALDGLFLEARYALTRREDVTTLGSGLDETPGNVAREVKVQLVWRW